MVDNIWENKRLYQQEDELDYDFQARKKMKRQERKLQYYQDSKGNWLFIQHRVTK